VEAEQQQWCAGKRDYDGERRIERVTVQLTPKRESGG